MDLIEHTYTIQWVGPMDYEEYREYLRNQDLICFIGFSFAATQLCAITAASEMRKIIAPATAIHGHHMMR